MKRVIIVAFAALAVSLVGGVALATGYEPSQHIVNVTKVVENSPEDAHFVIDVCGHPLSFNENGGTQSVTIGDYFSGDQECQVVETDDGGADSVEGEQTCSFTGKTEKYTTEGTEEKKYPDQVCDVTITNEFEETTTTTAPAGETVIVVPPPPAQVIERAPVFTG